MMAMSRPSHLEALRAGIGYDEAFETERRPTGSANSSNRMVAFPSRCRHVGVASTNRSTSQRFVALNKAADASRGPPGAHIAFTDRQPLDLRCVGDEREDRQGESA